MYEESVASIKSVCTRHKIGYALHSALMGKNYVTWDGTQLLFNVYNRVRDVSYYPLRLNCVFSAFSLPALLHLAASSAR